MADIDLTEGGLCFHFAGVEFAEKYDDWEHYRKKYNSACGSSKAVDFLVSKDDEIWLIEVKDYRHFRRTKPLELSDEICLKVRDTLAGIVSTKFLGENQNERDKSHATLTKGRLRVALFLEQPEEPGGLVPRSVDMANLKMKLRQKLRFADPNPVVTNSAGFPQVLPVLGHVSDA